MPPAAASGRTAAHIPWALNVALLALLLAAASASRPVLRADIAPEQSGLSVIFPL